MRDGALLQSDDASGLDNVARFLDGAIKREAGAAATRQEPRPPGISEDPCDRVFHTRSGPQWRTLQLLDTFPTACKISYIVMEEQVRIRAFKAG
jgi:hypothetical protein